MRKKVGLGQELKCSLVVAESLCDLLLLRKEFLQWKLKKLILIRVVPALLDSYPQFKFKCCIKLFEHRNGKQIS